MSFVLMPIVFVMFSMVNSSSNMYRLFFYYVIWCVYFPHAENTHIYRPLWAVIIIRLPPL
nr:MAG TPA: hypothetical protein [Caudoviricetes sp.]